MRIRRHVSLTLDGELIRKIDEVRGYVTRSVFIELLLRRALQENISIQGGGPPAPASSTDGPRGGHKEEAAPHG